MRSDLVNVALKKTLKTVILSTDSDGTIGLCSCKQNKTGLIFPITVISSRRIEELTLDCLVYYVGIVISV